MPTTANVAAAPVEAVPQEHPAHPPPFVVDEHWLPPNAKALVFGGWWRLMECTLHAA